AAMLQQAKPLLKQIAAPVLSLMLRKRFAAIAGIGPDELDLALDIKAPRAQRPAAAKPRPRGSLPATGIQVTALVLALPSLAKHYHLSEEDAVGPELTLLAGVVDFCRRHPDVQAAGLIEAGLAGQVPQPQLDQVMSHLAWMEQLNFTPQQIELEFHDGLAKMKKELEKKLSEARFRMAKSTADLKANAAPGASTLNKTA
ncbi:MAG: hypothetical protein ABIP64_07285, partial [Burkholderiales bacterium]